MKIFVAAPPLFAQQLDSTRSESWALHRLKYRRDVHQDIQVHNLQILFQRNLVLKFEIKKYII